MPVLRSACCATCTVLDTAPSSIANEAKVRMKPATMNSGRTRLGRSTEVPSRIGITGRMHGEAMVSSPASKASGVSKSVVHDDIPLVEHGRIGTPARIWHMSAMRRWRAMFCVRRNAGYIATQKAGGFQAIKQSSIETESTHEHRSAARAPVIAGRVKFEVRTAVEPAMRCNCSLCRRKGALMTPPFPADDLKILSGEEALTLYQFNTRVAKHYFCKHCGIYHVPSDPQGPAASGASTSVAWKASIRIR